MGDLIVSQSSLPDKAAAESLVLDLTEFEQNALNLKEQAERAEITDEKTYAKGGDLVKIANQQVKAIESKRTGFVKPFNALVKFVNDACKPAKDTFADAQSITKKKMLAWKREEDRKRAEEARKAQEKLEQEALERAAAAKTDEDQDAVMEAAVEASAKVEENSRVGAQYGSYGTTSSSKIYTTNVVHTLEFIESLLHLAKSGEIEIESIVEFKKSGLNKLAKYMLTERTAGKGKVSEVPGAGFTESDNLRVI